jgi:superfamily II RNA helicase
VVLKVKYFYTRKKQKLNFFVAETNVFKIVKMIMERNLAPVIVFSFSKKDCETYACATAKLDFNSGLLQK